VSLRKILAPLPAIIAAPVVVILKHRLHLHDAVFLPLAGVVVFLVSIAAGMIVSRVTMREIVDFLFGQGPGAGSGVPEPEPAPTPSPRAYG
jgi:hypothetical protein